MGLHSLLRNALWMTLLGLVACGDGDDNGVDAVGPEGVGERTFFPVTGTTTPQGTPPPQNAAVIGDVEVVPTPAIDVTPAPVSPVEDIEPVFPDVAPVLPVTGEPVAPGTTIAPISPIAGTEPVAPGTTIAPISPILGTAPISPTTGFPVSPTTGITGVETGAFGTLAGVDAAEVIDTAPLTGVVGTGPTGVTALTPGPIDSIDAFTGGTSLQIASPTFATSFFTSPLAVTPATGVTTVVPTDGVTVFAPTTGAVGLPPADVDLSPIQVSPSGVPVVTPGFVILPGTEAFATTETFFQPTPALDFLPGASVTGEPFFISPITGVPMVTPGFVTLPGSVAAGTSETFFQATPAIETLPGTAGPVVSAAPGAVDGAVVPVAQPLADEVFELPLATVVGADGRFWTAPQVIEANPGSAQRPDIAFDASGNAVAVWDQSDGIRTNIWANRFTPALGWGTPELIETDDSGSAFRPQVAMDTVGNAIAVWYQFDGIRHNIRANRFTPATGWGTPELIETDDTGNAVMPEIAMNATGDAIVVWSQADADLVFSIFANRFSQATGWGTPEVIEGDQTRNAEFPDVGIDVVGNALAVWQQGADLVANRFEAGAGWGAAETLFTSPDDRFFFPRIAVNEAGQALAVWRADAVFAVNFVPGVGWAGATALTDAVALPALGEAFTAIAPKVAIDPNGSGVAVWPQPDDARFSIFASRFTTGGAWSVPELLEDSDVGEAFYPDVAVDPAGNALAVWEQQLRANGPRRIVTNRLFGPVWEGPRLLGPDVGGPARFPQVAFDPFGNAIALWQQSDTQRFNILAARFE